MDVVVGLVVFAASAAVGMLVFAYLLTDSGVVPPADAFFLYVEDAGAPQHVGGMVLLGPDPGGGPTVEQVRALVKRELLRLPRFRQRLHSPGRWRRLRWVESEIDWNWHVTEVSLETVTVTTGPVHPATSATEAPDSSGPTAAADSDETGDTTAGGPGANGTAAARDSVGIGPVGSSPDVTEAVAVRDSIGGPRAAAGPDNVESAATTVPDGASMRGSNEGGSASSRGSDALGAAAAGDSNGLTAAAGPDDAESMAATVSDGVSVRGSDAADAVAVGYSSVAAKVSDETAVTSAMCGVVSELAGTPLPRDRPLWRLVVVRSREFGVVGIVLVLHHTVADGIGTVVQALHLLRPRVELPSSGRDEPSRWGRAGATAIGLAQLAVDSRPSGSLPPGSERRRFSVAALDLETVRGVARSRGMRVTDVLLSVVATAVQRLRPDLAEQLRGALRVAVPLMVRAPSAEAEGNRTAAVMIDLPLADCDPGTRLADIAARSARLHTGTRAVASHFVMATALRALPEPAVAAFAQGVYGGRFFHAIVSNMAGPNLPMTFANLPVTGVFPILPAAPGVPLVAGVLSWHGVLGVGLSVDPAVLDPVAFADMLPGILAEFGRATRSAEPGTSSGSGE